MWHVLSKYNREGDATFSNRPTTDWDAVPYLARAGSLIAAIERAHGATSASYGVDSLRLDITSVLQEDCVLHLTNAEKHGRGGIKTGASVRTHHACNSVLLRWIVQHVDAGSPWWSSSLCLRSKTVSSPPDRRRHCRRRRPHRCSCLTRRVGGMGVGLNQHSADCAIITGAVVATFTLPSAPAVGAIDAWLVF